MWIVDCVFGGGWVCVCGGGGGIKGVYVCICMGGEGGDQGGICVCMVVPV